MRRIFTAITILLLALADSVSADPVETETVGQFLISMPGRSVDPIIEYCSANVPEIKDDLLNERGAFIDKLTEAGKSLKEKLENDPEFNSPVQESMRQEIARANSYALSIFRQRDPDVACRTGLENMQNATVEDLRKVIEDTYQKFRGAGQAKNAE